jgi:hypothetical protein
MIDLMSLIGTFETSRDVRSLPTIRRKADVARTYARNIALNCSQASASTYVAKS